MKDAIRTALTLAVLAVPAGWALGATAQTGSMGGARQAGMPDAELLDFIRAANDAEIEAAKTAMTRARSKDVKKFAQMMARDHSQNNEQVAQLERSRNLVAQEGEMSRELRDRSKTELSSVAGFEGRDFDAAYVDQQVKAHREVVEAIDRAMGSGAGRPEELTGFLRETRAAVEKHLGHAEKLQAKLRR